MPCPLQCGDPTRRAGHAGLFRAAARSRHPSPGLEDGRGRPGHRGCGESSVSPGPGTGRGSAGWRKGGGWGQHGQDGTRRDPQPRSSRPALRGAHGVAQSERLHSARMSRDEQIRSGKAGQQGVRTPGGTVAGAGAPAGARAGLGGRPAPGRLGLAGARPAATGRPSGSFRAALGTALRSGLGSQIQCPCSRPARSALLFSAFRCLFPP